MAAPQIGLPGQHFWELSLRSLLTAHRNAWARWAAATWSASVRLPRFDRCESAQAPYGSRVPGLAVRALPCRVGGIRTFDGAYTAVRGGSSFHLLCSANISQNLDLIEYGQHVGFTVLGEQLGYTGIEAPPVDLKVTACRVRLSTDRVQ